MEAAHVDGGDERVWRVIRRVTKVTPIERELVSGWRGVGSGRGAVLRQAGEG
jgi:hypothetical protein